MKAYDFERLDEDVKAQVSECQRCREHKDACRCAPIRSTVFRGGGWPQPRERRPLVLFHVIGNRGGHHSGSYKRVS